MTLLPRTTAFGYFPHNMIGLNERITEHLPAEAAAARPRERLWQVRAARVVLATGSIERPLVFPGNDRPGVMLASAARSYLHRHGVAVGQDVVLVTGCDAAYATALDLHAAGVRIALIADVRADAAGAPLEVARQAGIEVVTGSTVLGTRGRLGIREVTIGLVAGGASASTRRVDCDALLVSGGYTPSVHLFSQSRGKLQFDGSRQAFLPSVSAEAERSAGSCGGVDGYEQVLNDGAQAGMEASQASGIAVPPAGHLVQAREFSLHGLPGVLSQGNHPAPSRAFIDFQNDVTTKDLALAMREGFESVEHIKRYTTTGMATDQGKTSNMNALAFVSGELGRPIPQVGLTTFRMPYTPVTFGIFAGYERRDLFDPVRTTPTHEWAVAQGRRIRGRRPVEARAVLPASRRGHARRGGRANAGPCARASACSMRRRSARSRWSGRMPRPSCRACTSTASRRSPSASPATASCCATMASSTTTASSRGSRRTDTTSPRPRAVRPASST